MQYAAKTHVGLVRQLNEDGYALAADLVPYGIAVLADGMGGHLAGEVASSLAVETVVPVIKENMETEDPSDLLMHAIQQANQIVFERANASDELSGMGTTLIVSLFDRQHVYLGHIGDSRGYLFQDGELRQVTDDHTLVNELFKNGQLTAEEAISHPQRNIVTRAVGTDQQVAADLVHARWAAGDILLLCSDGLTDMVPAPKVADLLREDGTLSEKVDALINQALAAGGHDNITVVAVQNQAERGETH